MAKRVKLSIATTYITVGICLVLGSIVGCHKRAHPDEAAAPAASAAYAIRPVTDVVFERTPARLERGKYLVGGLLQCFNCHTDRDWTRPGAPPLKGREGSGHVWRDDGEFRLVAPNITPDKETGAGTWTDDMLARSIREGISHDGRVLHPQMWYASFRSLSDEDLASVIVFLRSLPPVRNALPKTKLKTERQPNQEPLTEAVFQPDMSDPVKRGGYLVRVADCVGCHTAFEAPMNPGFFGGGNLVELEKEKAFSANLTSDPSGISYYDEKLFIQVLRTGHVKARKLSSIMPWVVFRNLNDEDMKSIFAYLRARRPVHHSVDNTEAATECAMCGQKHGFGDRNHPKIEQRVEVDPSAFAAYAGEYRFDDGFVITILTGDGKLYIKFPGDDSKLELVAISATEFTANEIPDVISFAKDGHGRVTHLISNVDDVAPRIK